MNLLQMSLSGAVFIAFIIVMRAVFLHKLPKKTFMVLWTLVLIRLLLPFSIPSVFSVYSWLTEASSTAGKYIRIVDGFEDAKVSDTPESVEEINQGTDILETSKNHLSPVGTGKESGISLSAELFPPGISVAGILGSVICAVFFLVLYIRSVNEFKTSIPIRNEFIRSWLKSHKLRRKIHIKYSDRISTPLSYGLFKPIILLPKNIDLSNTEVLSYVLTHEYIHIKRFDILTKMFLITALCIHWFNPAVWIMFILFNRDIEFSCDETVVRVFGEKSKEAYASALIDMEAKKSELMPLCSNFSNNPVKERVISVMKIKKTSLVMILFAIVFVFGTAVLFMTSAKKEGGQSIAATDNNKNDDSKLKAYENMTIADYSKVLKAADDKEHAKALEENTDNREFLEGNLFYDVLPRILGGKWKMGVIEDDIKINDNSYRLGYTIGIGILKPEKLMVGEYKDAVEEMYSGVNSLKEELSRKELNNTEEVDKEFNLGLAEISEKISNDNLTISLESESVTKGSAAEGKSIGLKDVDKCFYIRRR